MQLFSGGKRKSCKKEILYRHIAWLTALRFQLRLEREWEHTQFRIHNKFGPIISELDFKDLDKELRKYVSEEELALYKGKTNIATQILNKQSVRLQEIRDEGYFDDFRHVEIHKTISELYADQGRCERIKNFPFPRQYSSVALWMIVIFSIIAPFGLLNIFHDLTSHTVWLTIPFSALIIWMFFLSEMIGDFSENPFEGTFNDVPITAISRAIEIDLRETMGD